MVCKITSKSHKTTCLALTIDSGVSPREGHHPPYTRRPHNSKPLFCSALTVKTVKKVKSEFSKCANAADLQAADTAGLIDNSICNFKTFHFAIHLRLSVDPQSKCPKLLFHPFGEHAEDAREDEFSSMAAWRQREKVRKIGFGRRRSRSITTATSASLTKGASYATHCQSSRDCQNLY